MISRAKDSHTPNRVVRVDDDLWEGFGDAAGDKGRAEVLREFMRWYRHEPGAKMPKRPPPT
jgi:hypothetical protein